MSRLSLPCPNCGGFVEPKPNGAACQKCAARWESVKQFFGSSYTLHLQAATQAPNAQDLTGTVQNSLDHALMAQRYLQELIRIT